MSLWGEERDLGGFQGLCQVTAPQGADGKAWGGSRGNAVWSSQWASHYPVLHLLGRRDRSCASCSVIHVTLSIHVWSLHCANSLYIDIFCFTEYTLPFNVLCKLLAACFAQYTGWAILQLSDPFLPLVSSQHFVTWLHLFSANSALSSKMFNKACKKTRLKADQNKQTNKQTKK
jgi:hypothetical protein